MFTWWNSLLMSFNIRFCPLTHRTVFQLLRLPPYDTVQFFPKHMDFIIVCWFIVELHVSASVIT